MSRKPRSGELSRTELWATTAIGMGTGLLPFIITGYISYYFTNVALIPASALVTIMFAARLFDAVQDIGIGTVLDRVRRPDGQCRPFYKWFALPYFIFAALLFLNPPLGATGKVIYAFVTYVGALFMVSFLQLPHSAQISLLTKESKEISTICSMRSITSSVVIVLFGLVLIPMLKAFGGGNMDRGFLPVGVIVGALGAASAVWSYFGTKDRHVAPPPKKEKIPVIGQLRYLKNGPWIIGLIIVLAVMLSYSFSSSMAIYYFKYVVPNELLAGIALVLLYIFIIPGSIVAPLLGEKLGRKRAIICGILSSVAGKLIMLLGSTGFVFAGLAMSGLGLGVALPLLTTLMPDIVDYGEWKSGTSTPGILYSALGLGSKMGSGLAVSVQLFILAASGFNADLAVQPPSAVSAIALSYIAVPLVCDLLALLAIHFYRIDRIRDQILQELDQRHAAQQELSAQQAYVFLISYGYIMPKETHSKAPESFETAPIGTGPYKLVKQEADDTVVLAAFDGYYGKAPGFANVLVKPPLENANAIIALENGEVDAVSSVAVTQRESVQDNADLTLVTVEDSWTCQSLLFLIGEDTDINLRKAVFHGLNRENLISIANEGVGKPAANMFGIRIMGDYAGAVDIVGYDEALALEYLAKSDYNGEELVITYDSDGALVEAYRMI